MPIHCKLCGKDAYWSDEYRCYVCDCFPSDPEA